jgi:hypothetical protein
MRLRYSFINTYQKALLDEKDNWQSISDVFAHKFIDEGKTALSPS